MRRMRSSLLPRLVPVFLAAGLALRASPVAARDPLPSFAPVLREAEPAVVNVATVARVEEGKGEPENMQDFMRRFFGEQQVRRSLGSGFILSADGYVVTNNHVVQGADEVRVRLATDEEFDAKVVGTDDKTDVALLHVETKATLPTLPLGDSDALQVGDWVLAIGNPFGLAETATAGIVSAKGRSLGAGPYDDFIQTDASINPGNSGGPLIDQDGRVVGINAAIVSPAGGNVGIGFAVPINLARWVVDQLRAHGRVVRGWIGATAQAVTPDLARSLHLASPEGAVVADVTAGGPAAKAGVKPGDVIARWGDKEVHRSHELPMLVAATAPGTRVPVTLERGGQQHVVEVTVAELRPGAGSPAQATAVTPWGIAVKPLPAAEGRRRGLQSGIGVIVADVVAGSPADDAGLEPGDAIVAVNRRTVRSPVDFRRAIGADRHRALLLVRRGDESVYVEMVR